MHYSKTFILPKYLRQTKEVKIWQKMEKGQEIGKHWLSLRHDLHVCERSRRLSKRFGRSPYLPEVPRKERWPFFSIYVVSFNTQQSHLKAPLRRYLVRDSAISLRVDRRDTKLGTDPNTNCGLLHTFQLNENYLFLTKTMTFSVQDARCNKQVTNLTTIDCDVTSVPVCAFLHIG